MNTPILLRDQSEIRRRLSAWSTSFPVHSYWMQELEQTRRLVQELNSRTAGAHYVLVADLDHVANLIAEIERTKLRIITRLMNALE